MDWFRKLFLSLICFLPTALFAQDNTSSINKTTYTVAIDFSAAIPTHSADSETFPLGYSTFIYYPNYTNKPAYISGISFSRLFILQPFYSVQIGASYHYLSKIDLKGDLMQGISQPYYQANYAYSAHSSQYLIDTKFRREFYTSFFPYLYLGLGMAVNKTFDYTTTVPDYLTVTPDYPNKITRVFTYSIGMGLDYFILSKLSVGLSYRFINFGQTALGSGTIRNTSMNAALAQSNLYVNSLFTQLTYYI